MDDDRDQKQASADSFGAAADAYRDSAVHRKGVDLEQLTDWCAGASDALDIATGAGHTAGALQQAGVDRVVAFDVAPEMVATAEAEYPGVEGVVGDSEVLPFETAAFDAVTCRIAAHHFPDPETFLTEVARVLAPGGTFAFEDNVAPEDDALATFINRVEAMRDPTHVEAHRTSQWHDWLTEVGFHVEETTPLQKTLDFDAWTAAQSLSEPVRHAVATELRTASEEASEVFKIRTDGAVVESFANVKALIKARLA